MQKEIILTPEKIKRVQKIGNVFFAILLILKIYGL